MNEIFDNLKFEEDLSPQIEEKREVLKRLFVGFSNKSKLETLRFFVI